jgi:hypothetical protein
MRRLGCLRRGAARGAAAVASAGRASIPVAAQPAPSYDVVCHRISPLMHRLIAVPALCASAGASCRGREHHRRARGPCQHGRGAALHAALPGHAPRENQGRRLLQVLRPVLLQQFVPQYSSSLARRSTLWARSQTRRAASTLRSSPCTVSPRTPRSGPNWFARQRWVMGLLCCCCCCRVARAHGPRRVLELIWVSSFSFS